MVSVQEQLSMAAEYASKFPGFKFAPTDKELICFYLKNKLEGRDVPLIPEVDVSKHEPWDLPAKSIVHSDQEWFFFSARGRKYPKGSQSKRMTELGYWKSTRRENAVKSGSSVIGTKRTLVFHIGRAPRGRRTEWMMDEYSTYGQSQNSQVLCRIRKNIKFHRSELGDQASVIQSQFPILDDSDHSVSRHGAADEAFRSVECDPLAGTTRCSPYYTEQHQFGFGSSSRQEGEINLTEPSISQKDSEDEDDDFCWNVLRDDILDFNEGSVLAAPEIAPVLSDCQEMTEALVSHPLPFQGTASRRIRLRKLKQQPRQRSGASGSEPSETNNSESSKSSAKSILGTRFGKWLQRSTSVISLIVLVMLVFLPKNVSGPMVLPCHVL